MEASGSRLSWRRRRWDSGMLDVFGQGWGCQCWWAHACGWPDRPSLVLAELDQAKEVLQAGLRPLADAALPHLLRGDEQQAGLMNSYPKVAERANTRPPS